MLSERRQLTVLFSDLVGSTFLAEELDPEELRDVLNEYQQLAAGIVEAFDGHIAQYLGDGLLIYFGFPNANEEDPVRAVRAGLGIAEAMKRQRFLGGRKALAARIGIHTGLVVAGEVGASARRETLALGSTPNVAARLQTLASPNSVVVSAETRRLTEGYFEFEELELRAQAGSQSLSGFRVISAGTVATRFDAAVARGLTPFTGRKAELELLDQQLTRARQGEGNVVVMRGEPGIGKTRLIHHFQRRLAEQPQARFCVGRASAFKCNDPFFSLAEALRRLLGGPADLGDETWVDVVESRLVQLELQGRRRAEVLLSLLGIPVSGQFAAALAMDPMQRRQEAIDTALELLLRSAQHEPLILHFEDVHWADPSTLEFLDQLCARLTGARLLVLLSARPEFRHEFPAAAHTSELLLHPLAKPDVAAMVQHVAKAADLSPHLVSQIVQRTDGVPLFVEELTKTLVEALPSSRTSERGPASQPIPSTLQDSLMARLDRLVPGKRVAQLASVLGREFALPLLSAVGVCSTEVLLEGIRQLENADLVRRSEEDLGAPSYAFKHALVQDVAYESLLKSDRRDYHGRIAQALTGEFHSSVERQPEIVAHHLSEAGLHERAIEPWLRAAQRSVDRGANAEALKQLERAREAVSTLPDDRTRWEHELQLEMRVAQVTRALSGYASRDFEHNYLRALELCRKLGDVSGADVDLQMLVSRVRCGEDFLARSMAHNPRTGNRLFWTMWGFGAYHQSRAELGKALDIGRQLVELAQDEPALLLEGHFGAGSTCYFLGQIAEAHDHLSKGWECFEALHRLAETSPTGHHAEVLCAGYRALCLFQRGESEAAEQQAQRAIELAEKVQHSYSVAYALTISTWLAQMRGERGLAQQRAAHGLEYAKRFGFSFAIAWLTPVQLWAAGASGRANAEAAAEALKLHIEGYRASGYRVALTYFSALLAELQLEAGNLSAAGRVLDEATRTAHESAERFWLPELYRLRAELCALERPRDVPARREALQAAIECAEAQGAAALAERAKTLIAKISQSEDNSLRLAAQ